MNFADRKKIMKHNYIFLILLFFGCFQLTNQISAQSYILAWSDEFDAASINTSNWAYDTGGGGWGNGELQTYTSSAANSYISNGSLFIKAINTTGSNYTSARLKTQGKKSWKYGKIEARIKLPYGKGIWPAFWMLGNNITTAGVGWPKCGEIDIMEMIGGTPSNNGGDRRVFGTGHWYQDATTPHASFGSSTAISTGQLSDDFHIFSIIWDAYKIEWYFDGIKYSTLSLISPTVVKNTFQAPFFIILNIAVGGTWPGNPDGTTVFPQTMEIDYVRVYQLGTAVNENQESPNSLALLENYPNPFNPSTKIEFSVPNTSLATLKVLNALGQEVATLFNGQVIAGQSNSVQFDGKNLTSGMYFSRLDFNGHTIMKKMMLVK